MLKTRADRIAVGLLVALVAVWVSPFFVRLRLADREGGVRRLEIRLNTDFGDLDNDAHNHYTHLALTRTTVVWFGQFPWRTHLVGGGVYLFAHPRDVALSPVFLPTLLFGEVWGMRLQAVAAYVIGALGMYYLCRVCLGFAPVGSFYAGALLVVAAWLPARLYTGCYDEWHFMLFPLILAFFKRTRTNWRYGIAAAMLLYVVLYDGKYILPISFLYLGLFGAGEAVVYLRRRARRWWEPAPRVAAIALLVVLLGLVKILPMLSILRIDDRARRDMYQEPHPAWRWSQVPAQVGEYLDEAVVRVPPTDFRVRWVGAGPLALVLALVAFVTHPRRLAGWMLFMILGVWLSLWRDMPVDLFRALWHLPLFRSIKGPARFFNWSLLFCLSVMGGCYLSTLGRAGRGALGLLAALVAVVGVLERPVRGNFTIQTQVFAHPGIRPTRQPGFYPVVAIDPGRKQWRQWRDYAYIRRNIGVINWYCPLDLPRAAIPKYLIDAQDQATPNPAYRGEAHFLHPGNEVQRVDVTPNRLEIRAVVDTPDTLVINQNYDPRWRVDVGTLTSVRMDTPAYLLVGLDDPGASPVKYDRTRREFRRLAVRLEAPGPQTVTLRFRPWDGYVGGAVSAAAWAGCLAILIVAARRTWRGRRAPPPAGEVAARGREPSLRTGAGC